MRVAIVGAGISGLAAATFLDGEAGVELDVLEKGDAAGGNVVSDQVAGFTLDRASNGWLDNEPAMARLLERTGLAEQVVRAADAYGERWIYSEGALHPAPLSPPKLAASGLLPWHAKVRMLLEPLVPRGDEAQSVASFVRRRLGRWFVARMVGPMVSGVYAADPDALELRSAFPRMAELEREYRSLFIAMMRLRRGGAPRGHLETLPGGAGALTTALARRLGERLRLDTEVHGLKADGEGWVLDVDGEAVHADVVILAAPAHVQARLVRDVSSQASAALHDIPYASVAVVATGWNRGSWASPPVGFGALAALDADLDGVLGALFTSNVFPGQAPDGGVLVRTIIGGARFPDAAGLDDQVLTARALAALERMGHPAPPPDLVRIHRHPRGIPQYVLGHARRVAAVRAAERAHPGLYFVGNHLEGIGVKDCVRAGEATAQRILEALHG